MGFPDDAGCWPAPSAAPNSFINPVLDYDWGREFNYSETSACHDRPPPIKQVIAA